MTLEQLRIFVAVAEREHLTQGAAAVNLSPSAASTAIRQLEDRYNTPLFNRVGRRVELTESGRRFLTEARRVLASAAAAELALSETGELPQGTLRLAASQTVAAYWLPPLLLRFHAQHPAVELPLEIGNTETVSQAVLDGAADLGFIEGEIDEPALAMRLVATDRLLVLVAPGHAWTKAAPDAAQFAEGPWILRERGSGTRSAFEASIMADGIDPATLRVALTMPSNEAILTAIASGGYAGVASERVAAAALAAQRLASVDFELRPRPFRMLWHRERYRTRAAQAFDMLLPRQLR